MNKRSITNQTQLSKNQREIDMQINRYLIVEQGISNSEFEHLFNDKDPIIEYERYGFIAGESEIVILIGGLICHILLN